MKNAFSFALSAANAPPAEAAPPRGPGSVWARQPTDANKIPARHITPFLASEDRLSCNRTHSFFLLLRMVCARISAVSGAVKNARQLRSVGNGPPGPAVPRGPESTWVWRVPAPGNVAETQVSSVPAGISCRYNADIPGSFQPPKTLKPPGSRDGPKSWTQRFIPAWITGDCEANSQPWPPQF